MVINAAVIAESQCFVAKKFRKTITIFYSFLGERGQATGEAVRYYTPFSPVRDARAAEVILIAYSSNSLCVVCLCVANIPKKLKEKAKQTRRSKKHFWFL